MCGCNKDFCANFLMESENKKSFKVQIKRITKSQATMWGLFALEDIP